MHNQDGTEYDEDLLVAIKRGLRASVGRALAAGVRGAQIIVDPGIGFGKTGEQNLEVLRRLGELLELGYPVLVGASRKSFLGRLFGQDMPMRAWGTAAAVTASILRGADIVRVHDVPEMLAVARVAEALRRQ
jgi:dihydropteroate synthase